MLEKHDAKRSRTARANGLTPSAKPTPGSISAKPTANTTSSGKTTATGKTPAVAPFGLKLQRYFTAPGDDGFANVEWELRTAAITGESGKMVFEQRDVEVPKSWSQTATNVVVQKYFRGIVGTPERERSVRQLISRVADTITDWGKKDGYFADDESARVFRAELKHLLVQQKMAFNSPVWFNVGIEADPQCSACFINSVDDTMESILDAGQDRGHAVQVRLGHRHQPVAHPVVEGAPERRRHRLAARSASCAASTRSPASSSRAARPAARPRWSSSTSTTPTSTSSSGARRRKRRRPGR